MLAVLKDGPIKTADDLKGKTVSVSSKGSLTDWLAQELSRQQGWGIDGIKIAPLGTTAAQTAALKTRQIDGMIVEANAGYRLEEDGSGRVLVQFGDRIKTFHIYVFYARRDFAEKNPEAVRGFLAALVRDHRLYARAPRRDHRHRAPHGRRLAGVADPRLRRPDRHVQPRPANSIPRLSTVLARSFVEMGMLPPSPGHANAHHRAISAGNEVNFPFAVARSRPTKTA